MKKYSKKIRKTVEDPKSEICGKWKKKKSLNKPYKLLYRYRRRDGWNPQFANNFDWKVYSEFSNVIDRDHEFEKSKRAYSFWEWDTKDEI